MGVKSTIRAKWLVADGVDSNWTRTVIVDTLRNKSYACGMEVHLSAEKEARLREVAKLAGKDAGQLVEEAVDRILEYDARFIEAVEEGRASARRGELLEHDDVVERIERLLRS